jgi:hypothetical protein
MFIAMKHLRIGDLVVIITAIAVIIFASVSIYSEDGSVPVVQVRVEEQEWVYDLQVDRRVMIPGPLGETEMVIEDGHVHVHDSPCQSKICVATGEISQTNEWIICLPNKVFINITGSAETDREVDEIVY